MGEYAKYKGEEIKIGTCEDMYYLRKDQAEKVEALKNNVDPIKDVNGIRFRFRFPDEDNIQAGQFQNFSRGVSVPNFKTPDNVQHDSVQFSKGNGGGFVVSLPCPFNKKQIEGIKIHRNGASENPLLVQERKIGDEWWIVLECPCCGSKWRCDKEDGLKVAAAFESCKTEFHQEIGKRIKENYLPSNNN